MIPVKAQATLVRLSRSSINITKRTARDPPRTVISAVCQKRSFISIVNPDAPRIVKIRKSAVPKIGETVESEKVLNLRNFLSVPKPAIEKTDTIDSVTRTFVEAVQLTSEGRGGLENTKNTAIMHEVLETNRREEPEENVQTENIITESRHQKEASVEEVSTVDDVKESEKEEAVVIESEVSEENSSEAVGEEKSLPVGEKKNVPQNEEVESDEIESDSSSDSDSSSSSSSSSSDSESDNDERENVGRIRLDQAPPLAFSSPNLDLSKLVKVNPHKPSIRFNRNRQSSFIPQPSLHTQLNIAFNKSKDKESELKDADAAASNGIEWWQRPKRFDRQELGVSEIDQINSGGADKTFN